MRRKISGWAGPSARLVLLAGAAALAGCQTRTERMTLPSGHYLQHPPETVTPPDPKEEKYDVPPDYPRTPIWPSNLPVNTTMTGPSPAAQQPDSTVSSELEEALQEHAEALAALKVAVRALEASEKRLEALAKKGVAVPPTVAAQGTPTSLPAPPPVATPTAPGAR